MTTKAKPKGLGRGLSAIFDMEEIESVGKETFVAGNQYINEVELDKITPNPNQPRTLFDEEALSELADSIRTLGIVQPLTLRKEEDGNYTIISGERRFRASKLAGLDRVPAYIRTASDSEVLEMALVENIQRQDLNAMEIAISLQRLVDECSITQEVLADRVGKKRSTVTNYIRLLRLPAEVQLSLQSGIISMGHARALINIEDKIKQISILKRIVKRGLSVRQTEQIVKDLNEMAAAATKEIKDEEYPEFYTQLVEHLETFFNQDISIKKGPKGDGKIVISFNGDKEVEEILRKFENLK